MKKKDIVVGIKVIFYSAIIDGKKYGAFATEITSLPFKVSGQLVCMVKGKPAAVAISHLEKV